MVQLQPSTNRIVLEASEVDVGSPCALLRVCWVSLWGTDGTQAVCTARLAIGGKLHGFYERHNC